MLFSETSTISAELTCPKCNDTYIRPRQLPCGHSLFTFCIKVTKIETPNEFQYIVGQQITAIPPDGFSTDEQLTARLNKATKTQQEKLH